jgi:2,3-bisphosphoglycerate-independent phosphoglycerate mutase
MSNEIIDQLATPNTTKIVLLVMDGLGGCPAEPGGPTELEAARTPNLDALAASAECGLLDPVYPGVTPGSGPAHLSLFGYDPVAGNIGRGVLSALGVNFPVQRGDVAARINFASLDRAGLVTDRRAGRISTGENARLCERIRTGVRLDPSVEWFIEPEKEHRAVLVLRGDGLSEEVADTDPQKTGVPPLEALPHAPAAERTAALVADFLRQVKALLADEPKANITLLRGFAAHRHYPTLVERFRLRSLALAAYPMYKGLARLVGMDVREGAASTAELVGMLAAELANYDFFFVHFKETDSRGEDGDFAAKVAAIEVMDALLPHITALAPDVLAVTGDHSTPAALKGHSWHPVPLILKSRWSRPDRVTRFDEVSCAGGGLGRMPSLHLMGLMLAGAMRLQKFGA